MPRRQKMTLVEMMIVLAIIGILLSITIPAMNQAQRRARHSQQVARHDATSQGASSSDGQLNIIQISELSRGAEHHNPLSWIGKLAGFAPIIISIVVIATFVSRFRQQMTRRRAQ